eukprot:763681-Hanusia_phi.AAC.11
MGAEGTRGRSSMKSTSLSTLAMILPHIAMAGGARYKKERSMHRIIPLHLLRLACQTLTGHTASVACSTPPHPPSVH